MDPIPVSGSVEAPRNLEAEKSLLSIIFLDPQSIYKVSDFLDAEDFYSQEHQLIFETFIELMQENLPLDVVNVGDRLEKKGKLHELGGIPHLSSFMDLVPDVGSIISYGQIVKEKATLRNLILSSGEVIRQCYAGQSDAREILDLAEKNIYDIAEDTMHKGFLPIRDVVGSNLTHLEKMEHGKGTVTGISSYFNKLDDLTSGFQPGDLIIVAGRPGMGKTAFCLNIARNICTSSEASVGFFSLEMSTEQLGFRLMCTEAEVDLQKMRSGYLSKEDFRRLAAATDRLSRARIFIDDTPSLDMIEMRSKARRLKREHGLDVLMVDYLQLMKSHGRYENRNLEIADISRNLKILAKELEVPVIALSQLSRQPERRGKDARPQLSDLRESGALEQDADLVIFLYREEIYNEDTPHKGLAEIIIAKQRNGPTGKFFLVFLKEYTKFYNEEPRE